MSRLMGIRDLQRQLHRDNERWPTTLTPVPEEGWPPSMSNAKPIKVLRSRTFLVQVFHEANGTTRLTVNRTMITSTGEWEAGITWDELQELKRQAGFGASYAIEIYPRDRDVVNVANLRHLWVLETPLALGWFAESFSAGGSPVGQTPQES